MASTRCARLSPPLFPGVPHQLCQFPSLREAARPIFEADRHAKKELKKHVRGVRPLERALEARADAQAEAIRGSCLAVRSALTDDGRPPLAASGLKLHDRLQAIARSIEQVEGGGRRARGQPPVLARWPRLLRKGLAARAPLWPPIQTAYDWVHQAAHLLANHQGQDAASLQQAYQDLLTTMTVHQATLGALTATVTH